MPFTCVESEDFCNMIRILRKDAFIPCADTIKSDIMSSFTGHKTQIQTILQVCNIYLFLHFLLFEFYIK